MTHILAIDQGTTSSRAIVFDAKMAVKAIAQREFQQIFPRAGWVEHNAEEIWDLTLSVCREALDKAELNAADLAGIGITNQRETTVIWDRVSGKPIHNALVWQDRRTSEICANLRAAGYEDQVTNTTGLLLDPYFSGTKISWLLDTIEGARAKAEHGDLLFGTIDSFLIWRLTEGRVHATDATNAARTLLYDIHAGAWSDEMCDMLDVPRALLPTLQHCAGHFGDTTLFWGTVPILRVAGDPQDATLGPARLAPGLL